METLKKIIAGGSLSVTEAEMAMGEIMDGKLTPSQIAGLIVALRMRGETPDEVMGFALAMRNRSARVNPSSGEVADTCGTGGDGKGTLNVSTGAALAVAATGIMVAKHGNRAMSSRAGSADVLAALGVRIDAPPEVVERCLNEAGIAFCFAPVFHPAMKNAAVPRRELGVQTIFNMLGPLTNPAGAKYQLIGVARKELLELEAKALARLGTGHSLVVHSRDGLDEMTTTAPTQALEVRGHSIVRRFVLEAGKYGLKKAALSDLAGSTPEANAAELLRVLQGGKGAFRDVIVYNAGTVCWLAGKAKSIKQGISLASGALDKGGALEKLERLKALSGPA